MHGGQAPAITLTDNLGRMVLHRTLPAGPTATLELPLTGLVPGSYTVQAYTVVGLVAERLAVQ